MQTKRSFRKSVCQSKEGLENHSIDMVANINRRDIPVTQAPSEGLPDQRSFKDLWKVFELDRISFNDLQKGFEIKDNSRTFR